MTTIVVLPISDAIAVRIYPRVAARAAHPANMIVGRIRVQFPF